MKRLPVSFYDRSDVVAIAHDLLGKLLVTRIDGKLTSGIITETEAYAGAPDRASHAYGGKVTARNKVMYGPPGVAYVYLCYGIHHLFNVVTNRPGIAHAVLVRAIHPVKGLATMHERRGTPKLTTGGPGTLSQALGIRTEHTGTDLRSTLITIAETSFALSESDIIIGPRIGVDFAKEDALLPYRFHFDARILS